MDRRQEVWDAWHHLRAKGFNWNEIRRCLRQLSEAIGATIWVVPELGVSTSVFPGEDEGDPPPSHSVAHYVLDHLLPHLADTRCKKLSAFLEEVGFPDDFLPYLILHAHRLRQNDAIAFAGTQWSHGGGSYSDLVTNFTRRQRGGQEAGKSKRQKTTERDQKIKARAALLLAEGRPERELAGILAPRFHLSPQQIRRILKKTDMR